MTQTFSPPERIGFIGLGKMGVPMTRNLKRAGFQLGLNDIDPAVARNLGQELDSPVYERVADLARDSRVVITMVPDGRIVRQVALGRDGDPGTGLIGGFGAGSVLIDMSSSAPVGTRELGEELAKRGIQMIDAPVSGGVRRAITGQLAVMIGGDSEVIERCRPILSAMGSQLFVVGSLGAGDAIKALNNYVSAAGLLAAAEGLVAAQRFGLDPHKALEVMNASTGKNNSTENKFAQFIMSRSFGSGFSIGLMAKDLRTALELAEQVEAPMPLGRHCVPVWNEAERSLGANADHTEIVRILERITGTELH
ncbi:MAG: NAD(P)-dependent oxidoreductase [Betaproteobacteria bacterium]|nr:MAG: NAD(P)-dependent oxidoreductase [Betaproteobacteria bacterium]